MSIMLDELILILLPQQWNVTQRISNTRELNSHLFNSKRIYLSKKISSSLRSRAFPTEAGWDDGVAEGAAEGSEGETECQTAAKHHLPTGSYC